VDIGGHRKTPEEEDKPETLGKIIWRMEIWMAGSYSWTKMKAAVQDRAGWSRVGAARHESSQVIATTVTAMPCHSNAL